MGKPLLAGVILTVLTLSACGTGGQPGSTATASGGSRPTSTSSVPSTATAQAQQNLVSMVKTACGNTVPPVIATSIPGATPTYTAHYALGTSCQWHTGDLTRRALVIAVTSAPYTGWRRLQASLTDQTMVDGFSAVRGHVDGGCTVLVDVLDVALDVELNGVSDPTCQTTTDLASQVLSRQR